MGRSTPTISAPEHRVGVSPTRQGLTRQRLTLEAAAPGVEHGEPPYQAPPKARAVLRRPIFPTSRGASGRLTPTAPLPSGIYLPPPGQATQGALAFSCVRRGKGKGSTDFPGLARKHRRDRWLVGAMVSVCVLVAGYVFVEAQQTSIQPTRKPVTPSRPPVLYAAAPTGSAGRPDAENANGEAQTASLPAHEKSCEDLKVLVDRSHSLPPDYVPEDLAPLWAYEIPTLGGGEMLLRREAAEHLRLLVEDAWADGEELVVASAHRSYAQQRISRARLASIYGSGRAR